MADTQKMVREAHLKDLAARYIGGLTHAHTVLSNHPGHHESDLSVDRLVETLTEAGLAGSPEAPLQYLMLNEHPSDPARPRRLGRLSLRGRRLLRQRRRPVVQRVPVFYGLEASLLPGGRTDLTPRLADHCALVIASRHTLPTATEHDPVAITELFRLACHHPGIGVLGHPQRFIEGVAGVDWEQIFAWARTTGTAVEVNLNNFPQVGASPQLLVFWKRWLKALAGSGVSVFIGTDIHNQYQLDRFILQWRSLGQAASRPENDLARFLAAIATAGVAPQQVISARYDTFAAWLQMDKAARATLPLDK